MMIYDVVGEVVDSAVSRPWICASWVCCLSTHCCCCWLPTQVSSSLSRSHVFALHHLLAWDSNDFRVRRMSSSFHEVYCESSVFFFRSLVGSTISIKIHL